MALIHLTACTVCISCLTDCLLCLIQYTNRAANCYALVVVDYALYCCAHDHITPLSPRNFFFYIFNLLCACGHQMHQQPVASVPFLCMWCWLCHIGIRILNQLTNCSVRFSSRYYASLPGETTSVLVISNGHTEASSRVINLIKKPHTKLCRKNKSTEKFQCIVRPVQSTQHVKCSAGFLELLCCPWWNV